MASISPSRRVASPSQALRLPNWRHWPWILFLALMLVPCFWHSRIQAGDLSSHLYNAWLALQIRSGAIHGLTIVPVGTNVAFDWILTALLRALGPNLAQRIAVGFTVLVFSSGALAFIASASGGRRWWLAPSVAVLAYGFVFHIGFFNFYLSLGISLWFLAAFWRPSIVRRTAATLLLVPAWLAHPLPVVWAAGAAVYLIIGERLPERLRLALLTAGIAALLALRLFLVSHFPSIWSPFNILETTGADQAYLYAAKYLIVTDGLLLLWLLWLARAIKQSGGRLALKIPAHLLLLTAAGLAIIPARIDTPYYGHALVYLPERMSLAAGVLLCAVLAEARPRRAEVITAAALAAVFFAFLFFDGSRLNRQEHQITALVRNRIPRAARVVFFSGKTNVRLDPLAHVIDRACVEYCFSYANYEACTRQFRIRAAENNLIVLARGEDLNQLATGTYVVRSRDVPLYQVEPCRPPEQGYCVRQLRVGERNGYLPPDAR